MQHTESLLPDPDRTISHTPEGPPVADHIPTWLKAGGEPMPGYTLVRQLGAGGFGQVWAASGPGKISVALKFVSLAGAGRIERSALDLIKHIRHPFLLVLFGAWERDGWLVIGMECADESLAQRLTTVQKAGLNGIPRNDLKRYLIDVAEVLDFLNKPRHFLEGPEPVALHHGDVKPHNLLRHGSHVKLSDFGLVRVLGSPTPGAGLTPAYAAPEVFEGKPTRWSDQFALAIAYCELRGGKRPTKTDAGFDLSMLPDAERPVVARALAQKPRERWPSCRHFVRELTRVYAEMPPEPVMTFRTLGRVRGEPPPFVAPVEMGADSGVRLPRLTAGGFRSDTLPALRGGSGVLLGLVLGAVCGGAVWLLGLHWVWVSLAVIAGMAFSQWLSSREAMPNVQSPTYIPWHDAPQLTLIQPPPPADSKSDDPDGLLNNASAEHEHLAAMFGAYVNDVGNAPTTPTPQRCEGHRDAVWGLALSADTRTLVSASMDQTVRVWDVATAQERFVLRGHHGGVTAITIVGNMAYSAGVDGTVRGWDVTTGVPVVTCRHSAQKLLAVAVTPDGQRIFAGGETGLLHEFAADGSCVRHIQGPCGGWITTLALNSAGTELAGGTINGHVWVLNMKSLRPQRHLLPGDHSSGIRSLAFSPTGTMLLTGREDGSLVVLNEQTSTTATAVKAHRDWVRGIAFRPDGQQVLTVSDDETCQTFAIREDTLDQGRIVPALDESMLACVWGHGTFAVASDSGGILLTRRATPS